MLRAIARQLVLDGHEVEILTSQPSYKTHHSIARQPKSEKLEGFTIRRLTLFNEGGHLLWRLFNMMYFPTRIVLHCLIHKRFDAIMASTAPPVVTGLAATLAAQLTRAHFIYHCMDIHPEIGRLSGEFRQPFLFRILLSLDEWSCRKASQVIVLSDDMAAALMERPHSSNIRIRVINNFSLPTFGEPSNEVGVVEKSSDVCRILFAGNIGRFQGLEAFIEAMAQLGEHQDVELIFLGEGTALTSLKKKAAATGCRISFVPHQSISTARAWMRSSDMGIVSLTGGIYRYAFPSKTMTYLEEGLPLLVAVERDSELARFVTDNGIGVTALPNDPMGIATTIKKILENRGDLAPMRQRARKIAYENFSEQSVLPNWSRLFRELSA